MSELCEWSRCLLNSKLHEAMNGEFGRHGEEMKRIHLNRSNLTVNKEKTAQQIVMSSSVQKQEDIQPNKIVFSNKESVISYFLEDLIAHYKFLPLEL